MHGGRTPSINDTERDVEPENEREAKQEAEYLLSNRAVDEVEVDWTATEAEEIDPPDDEG